MTRIKMRIKKRPSINAAIGGWIDKRRFTQEFLSKVGFEVEASAKRKVPVDTGRLRASIATAWRGHSPRLEPHPDQRSDDAVSIPLRPMTVHVGTGVNYGSAVHRRHKTKGKFLTRAVREVRGRLHRIGKRYDSRGR